MTASNAYRFSVMQKLIVNRPPIVEYFDLCCDPLRVPYTASLCCWKEARGPGSTPLAAGKVFGRVVVVLLSAT